MVFDIDKELERIVGKEVPLWLQMHSNQSLSPIPESIQLLLYNSDRSAEDTAHVKEWFNSVVGPHPTIKGRLGFLDSMEVYPDVCLKYITKELQQEVLAADALTVELQEKLFEQTDVYEDADKALKQYGPKKLLELFYKREVPDEVLVNIPEWETDGDKVLDLMSDDSEDTIIPYRDMVEAAYEYCKACGGSVDEIGHELEKDGYTGERLFRELPKRLALKGLDCSVKEHVNYFSNLQSNFGVGC